MNAILAKLASIIVPMLIEKLTPILVKELSALFPVIAAAVAKAIAEQLKSQLPDLHVSLPDLAETVRNEVNKIPDIDIPILSDIFDLTEFIKKEI